MAGGDGGSSDEIILQYWQWSVEIVGAPATAIRTVQVMRSLPARIELQRSARSSK